MVYELEKEHKKTSLMSKKKEELVKEVSRLEHNVNVLNERLNVQASAIKQYEQESRNKAIDEFVSLLSIRISEVVIWDMLITMNKNSSLSDTSDEIVDYVIDVANKLAQRLKGGE